MYPQQPQQPFPPPGSAPSSAAGWVNGQQAAPPPWLNGQQPPPPPAAWTTGQPPNPRANPYAPTGLTASGYLAEVKPSADTFWKSNGLRVALACAGAALIIAAGGRRLSDMPVTARLITAGVGLLIAAVVIAGQLLISRVKVSGSELVVRNSIGLTRHTNRAELAMAILAVSYRAGNVGAQPMLLVPTSTNKRALRMSGFIWSRDSMERVLAALALPRVDVIAQTINFRDFDRRYPKLLPVHERRPIAFALVTVGILLAVIVAVVVVVSS